MSDRVKNIILPVLIATMMYGMLAIMLLGKPKLYSDSERRELKQAPKLTVENVKKGEYMTEFESYALDQFPLRDGYRAVKALFCKNIYLKKDNNDIYVADGYVSKLEYPISYPMLDHAAERFEFLYNSYMKDKGIKPYMVIVPDKNYYLADKNNYLSLDYDELFQYIYDKTDYMQHIDITDKLDIDDYYRTDTHWKQECIVPVAEYIAGEMGAEVFTDYTENVLDKDFYGVYYGQAALLLKPDTIKYLTSETMEDCNVYSYDTGMAVPSDIYVMDKAYGKDPYEMFLNGSTPVICIENPNANNDRHLIIFRDSFGASLAPLLIEGYSKITLVDIRYVQSAYVGAFVDFEGAEVLFMYSTMLLNNSMGMR